MPRDPPCRPCELCLSSIRTRRNRLLRIKQYAVSKAVDRRVAFVQRWPTRFECHLQSDAIFNRQLEVPNIEMRSQRWMWLCADRRQGLSGARKFGIDANDGVLRREFLVRYLNQSIAVQHYLKPVDRFEPGEVLDVSEWLGRVPRDDHTIRELFDVMRSGHSRLKEDADSRRPVDQSAGGFRQRFESADGNASFGAARTVGAVVFFSRAKADGSGRSYEE